MKFRKTNHPTADYHGVRSKLWTTMAEYGVIAAEVVLIACFAVPLWGEVMNDQKLAEIKAKAKEGKALEIHILAKQFDWNARYAGPDGIYSSQSIQHAHKSDNPFGMDFANPDNDDVTVLGAKSKANAIMVPWGTPVALKITSMDVIHSFKVLPLRVCKDAIPGLQLPIHFEVKPNLLGANLAEDSEFVYLITCAQLCGDGHGYMNGYLKVISPSAFREWLARESKAQGEKRRGNDLAAK